MANHPTALLQKLRQTAGHSDETTPDHELLRRFAEHRDETAFAALVRRYAPMVLGVGLRALHHRQDAEDVCQATFLTLAQKAARGNWRESVAGWLYDVARRHAGNVRATAKRRAAQKGHIGNDPQPDAAAEATLRELQAALDEELGRLPEKYRTPLVLCCLEGTTRDEAAQYLGLSLSTVKSRIEEGRERLRRRLTRRGLTLPAVLAGYTLLSAGAARAETTALVRTVTRFTVGPPPPDCAPGPITVSAREGVSNAVWKTIGVLSGVLIAAGVLAAGLIGRSPTDVPPFPRPSAARPIDPQPPLDRHGDPLPDGAVLRLGTTRLRHAHVFSLAFTAEGKLTSFGQDYVVKVWDPASGQIVRERKFEKEQVHRFWGGCLSPDGLRLAVQRNDKMKVYDVDSGKELASVKLAGAQEAMARFSPDSKHLAVVDQDNSGFANKLQLCDVGANTSREITRIKGYSSEPVFSRDGARIALTERSAGVGVWEVVSGRELLRFKPEGMLGGTVDFDSTGDVLAVLGAINPPQAFHYVQVSTGKPPKGWTAPAVIDFEWVRFAPDGSSVLFGGRKALVCYDPKTGKQRYDADGWAATPPAFSPDGQLVASSRPNAIRLWNVGSGRSTVPPKLNEAPEEEVHGVSVSPDGKWMLTKGGDTGAIRVWDSDGQPKGDIKSNRWGGRYPLFSPDGRHLFGVAPDAIALVRWDFPGGKESARYTFADPSADQVYVYHFGLSADGTRLAAITQTTNRPGRPGGGGGPGGGEVVTFTLWDVVTAKRLESREREAKGYMGYGAFAPDLRWYVHGDRVLALAGPPEFRLELPEGSSARQGAVSPDGRLVAQLIDARVKDGIESRVVIHETATGKPLLTLPTGSCGPIAFTPDGRGLVVTDTEAITRWDLATRKSVVRHKSPGRFGGSYGGSFASSLVLTPDGTRAVTGQSDTTAVVWDLRAPVRGVTKLTDAEMVSAWTDLGGADAGKAYAAVWALTDAGAGAVPFLAARVKPVVAPAEDRVRKLVAQLGAEEFADRESAERELGEFGDAAAPALREAVQGDLSAEQARRAKALLTAVTTPTLGPGDRLRAARAVAVLERLATKDARDLLGRLAKGAPGARLTREAADALKRLGG